MIGVPAGDLDHILNHTAAVWPEVRGQRLFITGGTGFFGCWLLESLARANRQLGLGTSAVVLTRDPAAFRRKAPHLASDPAFRFHEGDVRSFDFPEGEFPIVIHAAIESNLRLIAENPLEMVDSIVAGTRRMLDFAASHGTRRFFLTSSGAVYGRQPAQLTHVPEEYVGGPDPADPKSAYGEGKRMAESLCAVYAARHGFQVKIARCFAFVGPHLPLDANYAVGNFVRDALAGGPIRIEGDGTPYRSYLYAADLAAWLWTILVKGQSGRPYNVGSAADVTIADLAREVAAAVAPEVRISIARTPAPGQPPLRYVPSVERARAELGLDIWVPLREGIRRMADWHRQNAAGKA
jgi:nucleoside-diphosphate-sugar epimerase